MERFIDGGEISVRMFENYAEINAHFFVKSPSNGEILLPYLPKGVICSLTVSQGETLFSEAKTVNIREFNATKAEKAVSVSKRIDGAVILKINEISEKLPLEIKVKIFANPETYNSRVSLVFPGGFGKTAFADISVEIFGRVSEISSPTHSIVKSVMEKSAMIETRADMYGESLILNIDYENEENGSVMVSRRIFGDNLALCSFVPELPKLCGDTLAPAYLEAIGGMSVRLLNDEAEIKRSRRERCFALHSVIPPKGIKILNGERKCAEEIYFGSFSTSLSFTPVEVMYAQEIVKKLKKKMENAPFEERCLIREEINNVCTESGIVMGDIALASFSGGVPTELISYDIPKKNETGGFLRENMTVDADEAVELILNSQTADGVIADISVCEKDMLSFSTAVCLIALYLYTKNTYKAFAKRSLDFLSGMGGYWAKTALDLWSGAEIDYDELTKKAEMKIMYQRVDELAVSLIKSYRRK